MRNLLCMRSNAYLRMSLAMSLCVTVVGWAKSQRSYLSGSGHTLAIGPWVGGYNEGVFNSTRE